MKRFLCVLIVLLTFITPSFAKDNKPEIKVYLNEKQLNFDVAPFIKDERTMVSIRAISDALGFTSEWDGKTQTANFHGQNNKKIKLYIDKNYAEVNGNTVTLDVPPTIIKDRIFIPLRFLSENMGLTVKWSDSEKSVFIHGYNF